MADAEAEAAIDQSIERLREEALELLATYLLAARCVRRTDSVA
ncbi:MAG: hypothetical protein U1E25_05910 [Methylocystis sp.]